MKPTTGLEPPFAPAPPPPNARRPRRGGCTVASSLVQHAARRANDIARPLPAAELGSVSRPRSLAGRPRLSRLSIHS